ncbi:MAG TPA: MFS transporter, partial [Actinoplanes sp.]
TLSGLGLGLTLPPSMDAALGALDRARGGVGNAVLQAMRQVGGAVGVAVLGTVLNGAYRDRVADAGLPDAARESVSAGVALAGDPHQLHLVQAAFAHGMAVSLLVAGAVALAGAVLALVLMPRRPARPPVPPVTPVLAESGV